MVLGAVELGKALSPDGDVTVRQHQLPPGEPVFAGVEATSISPGTCIRLDWVGPRACAWAATTWWYRPARASSR